MNTEVRKKLFGVGPIGAAISFVVLAMGFWVDRSLGHPTILTNPVILKVIGAILVLAGLALHSWSMYTLRNWWTKDQLCTSGPFRFFRHPLYAAWITFVLPGVALYLNSWTILFFIVLLHPIWHLLVISEEMMMLARFADEYPAYAARTWKFFPRLWHS